MPAMIRNRVDGRWDVAIVASVAGFFAVATNRNMGWFYVAYMEEFGVDRQGASWPASVLSSTFRCAGLLVTLLHRYLSLFSIGLMGSVLLWSSLIASAFAPTIGWMTVIIGGVYGIGSGVVLVTHIVLIMQYFRKYRGIAAGLRLSSNPVSAIVFPAVLSSLKGTYGFRGASLVFGAITMHVTAFCIMLKDPPWLTNNRTKEAAPPTPVNGGQAELASWTGRDGSSVCKEDALASVATFKEVVVTEKTKGDDSLVPEALALIPSVMLRRSSNVSARQNSETKEKSTESHGLSDCTASSVNNSLLPVYNDIQKPSQGVERDVTESQGARLRPVRNSLPRLLRGTLSRLLKLVDPAILPSPGFVVAVLVSLLLDYVNNLHLTTMVDYARDKGVPPVQATMTIAYAAAPEILGRILLPLVADLGWVTRPTVFCGALFSLGLLFAITPETTVVAHVVVRAVSSISMAGLLTMRQVLIADYLGAKAVSLVMGAAGLVLVPVQLTNPLIIGHFRDTEGSYDNLYRITAGIILCTAIVLAGFIISSRRTKPPAVEDAACRL